MSNASDGRKKIRACAAAMLGRRELSKKALYDRLVEKGYDPGLSLETAEWFEQIGAVNDGRFADSLANRYRSRGYGPYRIRNELIRHGIDPDGADEAVSGLPEDTDALDRLVRSRLKGREPDEKELRRLSAALYRRGFGWDEIRGAIGRNTDTEDVDE